MKNRNDETKTVVSIRLNGVKTVTTSCITARQDTNIDDLIKGKMVSAYFFLNTSPIKVFMGKSQPKTSECMGRNEAS